MGASANVSGLDQVVRQEIRERRLALGLTGAQVAQALGVSTAYISLIESGGRVPRTKKARALAQVLGLDPDRLLAWVRERRTLRDDEAGEDMPLVTGPLNPTLPTALPSRSPGRGKVVAPGDTVQVPLALLKDVGREQPSPGRRVTAALDPRFTGGSAQGRVVVRASADEARQVPTEIRAGDWLVIQLGLAVEPGAIHVVRGRAGVQLGRVVRNQAGHALLSGGDEPTLLVLKDGNQASGPRVVGRISAIIRSRVE